jgi:hypothetical protein
MGWGAKYEKGAQRRSLRLSWAFLKSPFLSKSGSEPIPGNFPDDFGKI